MSEQLTLPIRDRRAHKRILTAKNIGGAAIVIAVLFAGVTIRSEMRHPIGEGYGRLFGTQVGGEKEIAKPKYDVVKEQVPDQTAADPTLLVPVARAQALGVGIDQPGHPATGTLVETATPVTSSPAPNTPALHGEGGVTIVGGAEGVTIVRNDRQRPVLAGGIFKH